MKGPGRVACQRGLCVGSLLAALASAVVVSGGALPAAAADDVPPLTGVTLYDPTKAMNGVTLDLTEDGKPTLFDMNGRVVHSWPDARVRDRARLLDNGNLLAVGRARRLVEYDWNGALAWEHPLTSGLVHHDVIRTRNGNTLFIVLPTGSTVDDIVEVDRQGNDVWQWRSSEYMGPMVQQLIAQGEEDVTHINSVHELLDNRLSRAGDARFRPGNILVSARNRRVVFVIDKKTKQIVWRFLEGLHLQHEALMIPDGFVGAGNILIFNNRTRRDGSSVLEVDPGSGEVVWRYAALGFFSPSKGIEQPLPNGNVLVTSSRAGRIFEITRDGEIVWEFVRRYANRAQRYPYDHCDALAKLERPVENAVTAPAQHRHIDLPLHRWIPRESKLEAVNLRERFVLKKNDSCDRMLVPASANLFLEFGLRPIAIRLAGFSNYASRFRLSISSEGSKVRSDLIDVTLRQGEKMSDRARVDLRPYRHQWISLCTHTDVVGEGLPSKTRKFAFWQTPRVLPQGAAAEPLYEDRELEQPLADFTKEELEVRQEHLKALGYVD